MDKNSIIGFALLILLVFGYSILNQPSQEELDRQQRTKDSLELVRMNQLSEPAVASTQPSVTTPVELPDSVKNLQLVASFGPFAPAATGDDKDYVLENDQVIITFSSLGGRIKEVEVKEHQKVRRDSSHAEIKSKLSLMEDDKNIFEYHIPVANLASGYISTEKLYFEAEQSGNSISFKARTTDGGYFEQSYTLADKGYHIDYRLGGENLATAIDRSKAGMTLNWANYLDHLELNATYEERYSTVYYKSADDDPTYCSCASDDNANADNQPITWVSHANQFFNTSLIAKKPFLNGEFETKMLGTDNEDLKLIKTRLDVPMADVLGSGFDISMYVGPNVYTDLKTYDVNLEEIIPYGWSIFGTVNRWIIRPIFNFLSGFIGNKGLVILLLTVLVKLALYPLMYKMLYSQSKMAALKPQMATLKKKFPDDAQKVQMETMKMYQEYGVSPLGGCLPMVAQMPIWFALYRFFPASIEFRQASFLWATDLSSYDVAFWLPWDIPAYGMHVSLFTILWAGTTLIYTYYNTKHMDLTANPAMKYMQYLMPVMFLFFFNSFAAGLTCYLLFSNLFNIGQTIITKNYIIDKDKIEAELSANKKKPKKKGGFGDKLQKALREQQEAAAKKSADGKKKKK